MSISKEPDSSVRISPSVFLPLSRCKNFASALLLVTSFAAGSFLPAEAEDQLRCFGGPGSIDEGFDQCKRACGSFFSAASCYKVCRDGGPSVLGGRSCFVQPDPYRKQLANKSPDPEQFVSQDDHDFLHKRTIQNNAVSTRTPNQQPSAAALSAPAAAQSPPPKITDAQKNFLTNSSAPSSVTKAAPFDYMKEMEKQVTLPSNPFATLPDGSNTTIQNPSHSPRANLATVTAISHPQQTTAAAGSNSARPMDAPPASDTIAGARLPASGSPRSQIVVQTEHRSARSGDVSVSPSVHDRNWQPPTQKETSVNEVVLSAAKPVPSPQSPPDSQNSNQKSTPSRVPGQQHAALASSPSQNNGPSIANVRTPPAMACFSRDVPEHLKQEVMNIPVEEKGCWVVEKFLASPAQGALYQKASLTAKLGDCHTGGAVTLHNGSPRYPAFVGHVASPLETRVNPQDESTLMGGGGYYSANSPCDRHVEIDVMYWRAE